MNRIISLSALLFFANIAYAQEAVDLGLSVKWANMNIGASNIYDAGGYFSWGETETKGEYDYWKWEKYFDADTSTPNIIRMKLFKSKSNNTIKGNKEYDVATKRLGGYWRMPTPEEYRELAKSCTLQFIYDKVRNIHYWKIIGENGNSIILPLTGFMAVNGKSGTGSYFWTSQVYEDNETEAYYVNFDKNYVDAPWTVWHMGRQHGLTIRPVYDEPLKDRDVERKTNSQTESVDINRVYNEEELSVMATFGMTLKEYFKRRTPRLLFANGYNNSTINADFIVERDGSLSNFRVTNGDAGNKGVIEATKNFLSDLTWIPATINGTPVRSNVSIAWRATIIRNNDGDEILRPTVMRDVICTEKEKEAYSRKKEQIQNRKDSKFVKNLEIESINNMESKFTLATMYLNGDKVEKDMSKALNLFMDIAVSSNWQRREEAQNILSNNWKDVLNNRNLVSKLSQQAAKKNNEGNENWHALCNEAAAMSGNKELVLKQLAKAKERNDKVIYTHWLMWAAQYDDLQSMYELSEILLDRSSQIFDSKRGIELLTKAADRGHHDARISLGYKYKYGNFVEKDKNKAKFYLKGK